MEVYISFDDLADKIIIFLLKYDLLVNAHLYNIKIDDTDSKKIYNLYVTCENHKIDEIYFYCIYYYIIKSPKTVFYCSILINKGVSNAMICLGRYYQFRSYLKYAKKYFVMAIENDISKNVDKCKCDAIYIMAEYYYICGKYEKVINYFHYHNNTSIKMLCLVGICYKIMKKYDLMMYFYNEAIKIDKNNNIVNGYLGEYYSSIGDEKKMVRHYIISSNNGSISSPNNLGYYYYNKGEYTVMMEYYSIAISRGCPITYNNLAGYYQKIGDSDNMMKILNLGIKRGYNYPFLFLGKLNEKNGNISEMKNNYLLAIKNRSNKGILLLGTYYEKNGEPDKAILYYSMGHNSKNSESGYYLGLLYKKLGKEEDMLKYLKISALRGNVKSMFALGLYYKDKGNKLQMKKYFLMGINYGDVKSAINMADYYATIVECERPSKYCKTLKYLKILYDLDNIYKYFIEQKLSLVNDVIQLIKYQEMLNDKNLHRLNVMLEEYILKNVKHDRLIDEYLGEEFECCVCFESVRQITLMCKHKICCTCYKKISACPLCRYKIIK